MSAETRWEVECEGKHSCLETDLSEMVMMEDERNPKETIDAERK